MDLHDHAVFAGHQRHLGQHLGPEHLGVSGFRTAPEQAIQQGLPLGSGEVRGSRCGVAVIRRRGPHGAEGGAALGQGGEIAPEAAHILAGQRAQGGEVGAEVVAIGIDHVVRAEGGDHAA